MSHNHAEFGATAPATSTQRVRITYAVFLAITLSFTLYVELHLRRWLSHHFGRNSIIAGSIPNFLAVLNLALAVAVFAPPATRQDITRRVSSIIMGLCVYEVAQIWLPHQVFDWNDIAATVLGGVVVWLFIYLPLRVLGRDRATASRASAPRLPERH